jgi:hypothetical protein
MALGHLYSLSGSKLLSCGCDCKHRQQSQSDLDTALNLSAKSERCLCKSPDLIFRRPEACGSHIYRISTCVSHNEKSNVDGRNEYISYRGAYSDYVQQKAVTGQEFCFYRTF